MARLALFLSLLVGITVYPSRGEEFVLDQPPHDYWKRPLRDPFTRIKAELETGRLALDRSGEKAFVLSLLKALDLPVSSQMLVFSTTSLQLSLITPANPRALYFNDNLYLGYVPGGRIEIVSVDPDIGGVFYIFNIPKTPEQPLKIERSERCMNCHAGADSRNVPGLVIKSVVPGPGGGSLTAYRLEQSGHEIPLSERFGGWYLTGADAFTNHWGNLTGRLSPAGLTTFPVLPGKRFDWTRYPARTSDLLPQLLHEHQAGFVNRVLEATYSTRVLTNALKDGPAPEQSAKLDQHARALTRYLLFADEAALPEDGLEGDAEFKAAFLKNRRATSVGESLKDLDLRTRLFKHRCSYMIYSPVFGGMPDILKQRVYARLREALTHDASEKEYAYLPASEKSAIRRILKETLKGLPSDW